MADVTTDVLLQNMRKVLDELPEVIEDAIYSNEKQILQLNKNQLYDGKSITGEDIRPYYTEDPYFKTIGQARGYIKWKQSITPNSKRNPNAPNLYINGYFHRSLRLAKESGGIFIISNLTGKMANDVVDKYENILGLTPDNLEKINNEIIIPKIWELLAKYV